MYIFVSLYLHMPCIIYTWIIYVDYIFRRTASKETTTVSGNNNNTRVCLLNGELV